jgi:DME family drug/metabolite transporter
MSAELLALTPAVLRGFSTVPTRRGLQQSTPRSSAFIYLLVNTAILWGMTAILYPLDRLSTLGLEYFVLAGLFAPGIARTFRDTSLLRLGVTLTSPIVATNTLFAVIFASLALHEPVTLTLGIGAILVVGGASLLSYRRGARSWRGRDLVYPLIAALLFAASTTIRKVGLQLSDAPILGAAVTSTISLLILGTTGLVSARPPGTRVSLFTGNREAVKYFLFASLTSSIAFLCYFISLAQGLLVRIQPIAATNPLFALVFSHLFLKDMEKITLRIVIGSALIFTGILFVLL